MPYIFLAILICSQMHGSERATPDLLLYDILVYPMDGSTIVLTSEVF